MTFVKVLLFLFYTFLLLSFMFGAILFFMEYREKELNKKNKEKNIKKGN